MFDGSLFRHTLADKRAIKGVEHARLDVIERSRVAVARALQIRCDLLEDAAGTRPHHDDAISQRDGFIDVVSDEDHHRAKIGP